MKRVFAIVALLVAAHFSFSQTIAKRDPAIAEMVAELNAKNLEIIIRKLVSFGTRHSLSTTKNDTFGIGAARNWVQSEFEKYAKESSGRMTVEQDAYFIEPDGRRITRRVEMKNVMATLKGTDPKDTRIFMVSGHLDSRASEALDSVSLAPGANDDASGVAVVMELARIMAKRKFPATIIFVAVQGEEQGLYGAKYLSNKAKEKQWNLVAMLNNDIVGNTFSSETNLRETTKLRVFSMGGNDNEGVARQLARYCKEVGERYIDQMSVTLIYRNDRYLRGGDHTPFAEAGFAAVRFTEPNEDFNRQHQNVRTENGVEYGDLPEFVNYDYLTKVAGINLAALASLASAPAAPENVGIETKNLTNSSTLKWEAPKTGPVPAGYYLLLRETSSAVWEKKIFVEKGKTEITVPYSKDNYFFGVQSVGDSGNESLAILPKAIR